MAGVEVAVVFAFKFIPNWADPRTPRAAVPMAVMVLEPEVSVDPLTVMAYPEPALVEAAICEVAVAVSEGEKSWLKLTAPLVAVEQSGTPPVVLTVPPVQKMIDSGIIPVSTIAVAVLAVTEPVSIGEPVASVEAKVEIRTKKDWFGVVGLVTL